MSKSDENSEADVSKTYSARGYGWHRLRSMRQEKLRNQGSRLNHPYPRAERKFRKGASLFSGFLKTEAPQQMQRLQTQWKGSFSGKREPSLSWQNSITREDQLAGLNRTANPLPEVHPYLTLGINSCFAAEAPLSPTFRNPAFACGDLPSAAKTSRIKPTVFGRFTNRPAPPQIQIVQCCRYLLLWTVKKGGLLI